MTIEMVITIGCLLFTFVVYCLLEALATALVRKHFKAATFLVVAIVILLGAPALFTWQHVSRLARG